MSDNMQNPKDDSSFVGDMVENVLNNYFLPGLKNTMHDAFTGFLNTLSGSAQASIDEGFKKIGWNGVSRINSSNTGTQYNKMYNASGKSSTPVTATNLNVVTREKTSLREIFLNDDQQYKDLMDNLQDVCGRYGKVKISDLYCAFDPPIPTGGNFMVGKLGWTPDMLGRFSVQRIYNDDFGPENRNKLRLITPSPISIVNI